MLDRRALYATSFVRAVTRSLVGVLLGVYLARLNVAGVGFGGVVSSGLAGAAVAAIVATLAGRVTVLGDDEFCSPSRCSRSVNVAEATVLWTVQVCG
jgi:hypothetical protein